MIAFLVLFINTLVFQFATGCCGKVAHPDPGIPVRTLIAIGNAALMTAILHLLGVLA